MKRLSGLSITFYCRNSKAGKTGVAPIEMGVNVNGTRVFINLPLKVKPEEFNKKRQPAYITDYLESTRIKVNEICSEMMAQGMPLTAESLREYFRTGGIKPYTVEDMVEGFLALKQKEVNAGSLTPARYRMYTYTRTLLYHYVKKDDEVTVITPALIANIYADLKTRYNLSTAAGQMTRLKTIVRYGIDNGKFTINPFQGIKIEKGKPVIEYLTDSEVERIYSTDFGNTSLNNVRDIFVLQASTGLSYVDILNLTKDDIKINQDGVHYISKQRHKTNVDFTCVILPRGVEVLKRHNYQMSIISNQKMNTYLKILGNICNIKKSLHSHLGRKTYATHLLNSGVRMETVAKSLGHTTTSITASHYAHFIVNTIIDEVMKKTG